MTQFTYTQESFYTIRKYVDGFAKLDIGEFENHEDALTALLEIAGGIPLMNLNLEFEEDGENFLYVIFHKLKY